MGRSVNYLNNAEYVIYFSADWLNGIDENGKYSQFEAEINWEDFISNLKHQIKGKLKSYFDVDKYDNRETLIFLENNLCEIGLSEYCGLYSLSIRVKESYYYNDINTEGLGKHHAEQIRSTLEKCLVNCDIKLLNRLGTFSNGNGVYEYAK